MRVGCREEARKTCCKRPGRRTFAKPGDPVCKDSYSDEELDAWEAEAKADEAAGYPKQFDGILGLEEFELGEVAIENVEKLCVLARGEDVVAAASAVADLSQIVTTACNKMHEIACHKPPNNAGKFCEEFRALLTRDLVSHSPLKVELRTEVREQILAQRHPDWVFKSIKVCGDKIVRVRDGKNVQMDFRLTRHPDYLFKMLKLFGDKHLVSKGGGPSRLMEEAQKYVKDLFDNALIARECGMQLSEEQQRVLKHEQVLEKFFRNQQLSESEEDNLFSDIFLRWIDTRADEEDEEFKNDYPDLVGKVRDKNGTLNSRFWHTCKRSLFNILGNRPREAGAG